MIKYTLVYVNQGSLIAFLNTFYDNRQNKSDKIKATRLTLTLSNINDNCVPLFLVQILNTRAVIAIINNSIYTDQPTDLGLKLFSTNCVGHITVVSRGHGGKQCIPNGHHIQGQKMKKHPKLDL